MKRLLSVLLLVHGGSGSRVENVSTSGVGSSRVNAVVANASLGGLAVLRGAEVVGREVLVVGELAALEVKRRVVASSEREKVEEGKHGLGQEVENTVENHLTVRRDCVGSVGQSPCNLRATDETIAMTMAKMTKTWWKIPERG